MAPNARENKTNKPAQPDPNNFRIPRVRQTARRSISGRAPRKTLVRMNTRAIRQLVIEAEQFEREQEAQQREREQEVQQEEVVQAMETTETRETTAAQVP